MKLRAPARSPAGLMPVARASSARRVCPLRHRLVAAAFCALAGSLPRPVAAQYGPPEGETGTQLPDAFSMRVGASIAYDTNLFRFPATAPETPSDTVATGYVGLHINQPYAQQRFMLDATATAYRYKRFSYLDFNGLDYRAAWHWHLTPRFNGTIRADRTEIPTQFSDTSGIRSNVVVNEYYGFTLDGAVTGGWHVVMGVSQSNRESERSSLQAQPDYHESRGEAGLRYVFPSGSEFTAVGRRVKGEQVSLLLDATTISESYEEDDIELRGTWNLTAKSILVWRATNIDRHYEQSPQRDFSGTGGELGYTWLPTSRLTLRLTWTRTIVPWEGVASKYRVSNTVGLVPFWQVTDRTNVSLNLQRSYDDYPLSTPAAGIPERKDTTTMGMLALHWSVTRTFSLDANVRRIVRLSNDPFSEYDTTISRLSATLAF